MVTEKPLAWSNLPSEAEIIPLPNEEVTPPVTKIYFAEDIVCQKNTGAKVCYLSNWPPPLFKLFPFAGMNHRTRLQLLINTASLRLIPATYHLRLRHISDPVFYQQLGEPLVTKKYPFNGSLIGFVGQSIWRSILRGSLLFLCNNKPSSERALIGTNPIKWEAFYTLS